MAMTLDGGEAAVSTSAQTLTTLLGLSAPFHFSHLTIRAAKNAVGTIYFGKTNVTGAANRCGYIDAGEAIFFGLDGAFTNTDQIWVVGTNAGDRVHILNMR